MDIYISILLIIIIFINLKDFTVLLFKGDENEKNRFYTNCRQTIEER